MEITPSEAVDLSPPVWLRMLSFPFLLSPMSRRDLQHSMLTIIHAY
jgi:hypothetical protein